VEAQATRDRRRRLLGDLPLLPPAAVVDTKPERASVHVKQRRQNARLKTTIIVPVAFVVETRERISAVHHSERAVCRMIVTLHDYNCSWWMTTKKKSPAFTPCQSKCTRTNTSHQKSEKGEKMHFVLILGVSGSEFLLW
jgi:hypothetical protein